MAIDTDTVFPHNNMLIFSHFQTRHLSDENAPPVLTLSTDLGLSSVQVRKCASGWQLPEGKMLTFQQIHTINNDENGCFLLQDDDLQKVEAFSEFTNRYYSLMPTPKAPTMLISGIPMHRIKGTDPVRDTEQKIKALGKPYGTILDTATGLGYTAIQAARTASQVLTVEFDPAVIKICRVNPWSRELFDNPNIDMLIGDTYDLADVFKDETFNAIIHDPPTFNLGGHLYSQSLYQVFYRILKPNGRVFHYIGNPDSRSGATTGRGVVERLKQSGFTVTPKASAYGVLGKK